MVATPSHLNWTRNAGRITSEDARPDSATLLPLGEYDKILLQFSGGKDSVACVIEMLRQMAAAGVPRDRLELWHQCIDGAPGSDTFMDWPVTESYCKAFAEAMGLEIRFQWKEGGFAGEMNRNNQPTAPTRYQLPDGTIGRTGGKGPNGTRMKFPQVSADLSVRWCSAYLKIDVGATAIRKDPRLQPTKERRRINGRYKVVVTHIPKILVITGERWEESKARSRYARVERHRASAKSRIVHQYRPVLDWNEALIWKTIREAGVRAHPCYDLGYSRASCATCIFGGKDEWATIREIAPEMFSRVADAESRFGVTINRALSVVEQADKGKSFVARVLVPWAQQRVTGPYRLQVKVSPDRWTLPAGAFRHTNGPC